MDTAQRAFSLVELVAVLIVVGVLAAFSIPKFVDFAGTAYRARISGVSAALQSAMTLSHTSCLIASWANKDNLPGYADGSVDFNTACYPTDTTGNTNSIGNNANRCMRVWNIVLSPAPTTTTSTAASGADFRVTGAGNVCTYQFLPDSAVVRQITYNALTGSVGSTNP